MLLSDKYSLLNRPRRNRQSTAIRLITQETVLTPSDFVAPFFVLEGEKKREPIAAIPGIDRLSIDLIAKEAELLHKKGVQAIALFPVICPSLKDINGIESSNPNGLIPRAIAFLKKELPSLCIISDIALDPYTSHGHDGIVNLNNEIDNDLTLNALAKQALAYAEAGCDILAPSDMMDGRIKLIRKALDAEGLINTGLLSYTAKYASSLYGPFRSALQTLCRNVDKRSYQMDLANSKEGLKEALLDEREGADMLMVKPALSCLDIIAKIVDKTTLPVGAYQVSGEYAMIMAADHKGWIDGEKALFESLLSIKRSGASFIFTYGVKKILDASFF